MGLKVWISRPGCSRTLGLHMTAANSPTIKIHEIFFSIQGESSWAGYPTVFVRTSGCHLRCTYCDTTHAYYDGKIWTVEEILSEVQKYPAHYVCVTGGEPLLQTATLELMRRLVDLNYHVSLETSGDKDCAAVDPRVKKIIDVKTPDSGEPEKFSMANLKFADKNTEFKFVIGSERDFAWAEAFARENNLFEKSNVLYSPSFKIVSERWLAEKILSSRSGARLQLQMHKFIWAPDTRGV